MGLFFSIGVAQEESNLFNEMPSRAVESVKNWKFVFQIKGYLTGCRPMLSAGENTKERQWLCFTHEERSELKGTLRHIPVVT